MARKKKAKSNWRADIKPGQVLKITEMIDSGSELNNLDEKQPCVWGIVLDEETLMVFAKLDQRGYPGANGATWTSRVYGMESAHDNSVWAAADEVPDDVPPEFWSIVARLALE